MHCTVSLRGSRALSIAPLRWTIPLIVLLAIGCGDDTTDDGSGAAADTGTVTGDTGTTASDTGAGGTTDAGSTANDAGSGQHDTGSTSPDAAGGGCKTNSECAGDQHCKAGTCTKDVCSAADNSCVDLGKAKLCKADGSGFDETPCKSDEVCDAGACKKKICTPGATVCKDGGVATCGKRGVDFSDKVDCKKAEKCVGGVCVSDSCQDGDAKCADGAAFNCVKGGFEKTECNKPVGADLGEVCAVNAGKAACEKVVCDKGKLYCDGSKLLKCDAKGTKSIELKDCGKGNICASGKCVPDVCSAGKSQCVGNSVATCKADGKSWNISHCLPTEKCKEDKGAAKCESIACVPLENFCEGAVIHKCNGTGDGSVAATDCATLGKGCKAGKCVDKACKPGTKTCKIDGTAVLVCAADGSTKVPIPCGKGFVCKGGTCEAVVCNKGELSCKDNKAWGCNASGTGFKMLQDCGKDKLCFGGACLDPVCKPGTARCGKSGQREVCVNNGLNWQLSPCGGVLVCKTGACVNKVCTPKKVACSGENVVKCNDQGTANIVVTDCAKGGKTCLAGACVPKSCKAGATTCNGDKLAVCKPDGSGWASKTCPLGAICESGTCKPVVCTKGLDYCNKGRHFQCNGKGTAEKLVEDCDKAGKVCLKDKCVAKLCSAGQVKCQGGEVATCHTSGLSWTLQSCVPGKACHLGYCVPLVCSPATVACGGDKVQKCNNTGTGGTILEDCGKKGLFCIAGKCVKAKCQPGHRKCNGDKLSTCAANGTGYVDSVCADGNGCTTDSCSKGSCVFSKPNPCEDNEPCTKDSCDAKTGKCGHLPLTGKCDDGSKCTGDGACDGGKCVLSKTWLADHVAGSGSYGSTDGPVKSARFSSLRGAAEHQGIMYIADVYNYRIRRIAGGKVTTLAGSSSGYANGKGPLAKFRTPWDLAVTSNGTLIVADSSNHRLRLVDSAGNVSDFAGSGSYGYTDGPAKTARIGYPYAVDVFANGTVYCSTNYSSYRQTIRKIVAGNVTTVAGGSRGFADGKGSAARFYYIYGLTHDPQGNIYVADRSNHRIRKVAPDGTVTTLAGTGSYGFKDGPGKSAQFYYPYDVQWVAGKVYVADSNNHRIRAIDAAGNVSTFAGAKQYGYKDGPVTGALFRYPRGIDVGTGGSLIVTDTDNRRVRRLRPPKVTCNDGRFCTDDACDAKTGLCVYKPKAPGSNCTDNDACTSNDRCSAAGFCTGQTTICDDNNNCTIDYCNTKTGGCETKPETGICDDGDECSVGDACIKGKCIGGVGLVSTYAGGTYGFANGPAKSAKFARPRGLDVNAKGELVIGDYYNRRVRKVDAAGNVTTMAGSGSSGYTDGPAASARFGYMYDVEWGAGDTVFVADYSYRVIRMVDGAKKVVSTLAGSSSSSCLPGKGKAARVGYPYSLAYTNGALYVGSGCYRILKIQMDGTMTYFSGSGSYGDAVGSANQAKFRQVYGLDADAAGNLWVADYGNRKIKRVAPDGSVQAIAGNYSGYSSEKDGVGTAATFYFPYDIAVGPSGDAFVATYYGNRIRKVRADGTVTTIVGNNGKTGSSGGGYLNGPAMNALLRRPISLAVASTGHIYISTMYKTGYSGNGEIRVYEGGQRSCNDNNPCTTDKCDKGAGGCQNAIVKPGTKCDDNNLCTKSDECSEVGKCAGEKLPCSDGNQCTDDPCDPGTGKCTKPIANNKACNDGNNCTLNEVCDGGACKHGPGVATVYAGTGSAGHKDGPSKISDFSQPTGIGQGPKGDVYVADSGNHRIRRISVLGAVSTIAGDGKSGFLDGAGVNARFNFPTGVAARANGDVLIADGGNHKMRRIGSKNIVSSVAGASPGFLDGPGPAARFNQPVDVAVDAHGMAYIADRNNNRVRRMLPSGFVLTHAGSGGTGDKDGAVKDAQIYRPNGVAIAANGALFVSDGRHRIRRIFKGLVTTIAGSGTAAFKDGKGVQASFSSPAHLAVDAQGFVYVADTGNHRIRMVRDDGLVSTIAGSVKGFKDGIGSAAGFDSPVGLLIDHLGNTLIGGNADHRIRQIASLRPPCNDGSACTTDSCDPATGKCEYKKNAGATCDDGSACTLKDSCNQKGQCVGTKLDCGGAGNKCVTMECDAVTGSCLTRFNSVACDDGNPCTVGERCSSGACIGKDGLVTTLAGSDKSGFSDGQGPYARFSTLYDVAVDSAGNAFVGDRNYHRVRKITPLGIVSTYAGTGSYGYTDGPKASARLSYVTAPAVAASNDLYVVSDYHRIRKVDANSGVVSTFAGSNIGGFVDAKGTDARFNQPQAMAIAKSGAIYVADTYNYRVRIVKPDGSVSTLAGDGKSGFADGPGGIARFSQPRDIALDTTGNVYVADYLNRRVRRVSPGGVVSTFAGSGVYGDQVGPVASARFGCPQGVGVDSLGNVFVSDVCTRKLSLIRNGVVSHLAGSGANSHSDGFGKNAAFRQPRGLAVTSNGRILVAGDYSVRLISNNAKQCGDGNPCTADTCDAKTGKCQHKSIADGTPCANTSSPCSVGASCKAGACQGGISNECNDNNVCTIDLCDNQTGACNHVADSQCIPVRRVFLTSKRYAGSLGGLAGADAICQQLASKSLLGGSWKAWLSDAQKWPGSRFNQAAVPYQRLDGKVVAKSFNDLSDGGLAAPITITEKLTTAKSAATNCGEKGIKVWTNTRASGARFTTFSLQMCDNWTSASGSGLYYGAVGDASATDKKWSQACTYNKCDANNAAHLYCVEQTDWQVPPKK